MLKTEEAESVTSSASNIKLKMLSLSLSLSLSLPLPLPLPLPLSLSQRKPFLREIKILLHMLLAYIYILAKKSPQNIFFTVL